MTLAEAVQWVGVIMAFVGTLAAAPGAWTKLTRPAVERARALLNRIRGRREEYSAAVTLADVGVAVDTFGVVKYGPEGHTVSGRLTSLETRMTNLTTKVSQIEASTQTAVDDIGEHITEVAVIANAVGKDLRDLVERSAEVDARALPSVGVGILLSGMPDRATQYVWVDVALLVLAAAALAQYTWARIIQRSAAAGAASA